jgi:hypothetical protein
MAFGRERLDELTGPLLRESVALWAAVATAHRPLAGAARAEEVEVVKLPDARGRRP